MAKFTRTWWGERFLEALEQSMDEGRLGRGRAYAGPNRLLQFSVDGQQVKAKVRGNINPYFGVYKEPRYEVSIRFKSIPKTKWNGIIKQLSTNAAWISRLMMNEIPDNIELVFKQQKTHLLPHAGHDLETYCSCPDWANPCKHVAGAYYKVASLLDRDPFLLFQLRGMDKASLQKALSRSPLGKALLAQLTRPDETPVEYTEYRYTQPHWEAHKKPDLKSFWQGEKSSAPLLDARTETATIPAALIKKQGDYPSFWERDNSFIEVMEEIYTRVVMKNKKDSL